MFGAPRSSSAVAKSVLKQREKKAAERASERAEARHKHKQKMLLDPQTEYELSKRPKSSASWDKLRQNVEKNKFAKNKKNEKADEKSSTSSSRVASKWSRITSDVTKENLRRKHFKNSSSSEDKKASVNSSNNKGKEVQVEECQMQGDNKASSKYPRKTKSIYKETKLKNSLEGKNVSKFAQNSGTKDISEIIPGAELLASEHKSDHILAMEIRLESTHREPMTQNPTFGKWKRAKSKVSTIQKVTKIKKNINKVEDTNSKETNFHPQSVSKNEADVKEIEKNELAKSSISPRNAIDETVNSIKQTKDSQNQTEARARPPAALVRTDSIKLRKNNKKSIRTIATSIISLKAAKQTKASKRYGVTSRIGKLPSTRKESFLEEINPDENVKKSTKLEKQARLKSLPTQDISVSTLTTTSSSSGKANENQNTDRLLSHELEKRPSQVEFPDLDVIVTLKLRNDLSSTVPLYDLVDIEKYRMNPEGSSIIVECLEDMINYSIDLSPHSQQVLLESLDCSAFSVYFYIDELEYEYKERTAMKYYEHCVKNRISPNLFIEFHIDARIKSSSAA